MYDFYSMCLQYVALFPLYCFLFNGLEFICIIVSSSLFPVLFLIIFSCVLSCPDFLSLYLLVLSTYIGLVPAVSLYPALFGFI